MILILRGYGGRHRPCNQGPKPWPRATSARAIATATDGELHISGYERSRATAKWVRHHQPVGAAFRSRGGHSIGVMTRSLVALRRPSPDDAEAIAGVHIQCWRETYATLLPAAFYGDRALTQRQMMWASLLAGDRDDQRVWIAEADDKIIGFALAAPAAGEAPARRLQLYMLYVLQDFHGSGAGQSLLDAVLGREPAQLWVARDNPRAHHFYRRNGFLPDGTEKVDVHANDLLEVRLIR